MVALDRAGAGEADEIPNSPSFVVGAGRARATERLGPDDGAGGLVVDVEVAGRVAEGIVGIADRPRVAGEDRAGESVRGRLVDEGQCLLPVGVVVDVGG